MALTTFGRKSTSDPGIGIVYVGNQRVSVMGSTAYGAWVLSFHARLGRVSAATPATVHWAMYEADALSATNLVGISGFTSVVGTMVNGSTGSEHASPATTPLIRRPNQRYALGIRCQSGGPFHHGQDHSGLRMGRRVGGAWPSNYNEDSNNPEGKMTIWVTEQQNRAPKQPSNVTPTENGSTNVFNPVIAADFRDDDEVLPGFTLGQADKLKKYQVRILNSSKASVLRDSGLVTASAGEQTARRSSWTVSGAALTPGEYVAQVTHYDMLDQPSAVKEWRFAVSSGGTVAAALSSGDTVSTSPLLTNSASPTFTGVWTHGDGLAMTAWRAQIRQQSNNAVVRALSAETALAVANGGTFTPASLFTGAGWGGLAHGHTYRFEVQGKDSLGNWSALNVSAWFRVNAHPSIPDYRLPIGGAVTTIPFLQAQYRDIDDPSTTLKPEIEIRLNGGAATLIDSGFSYMGDRVWGILPSAAIVNQNGFWEWRTRSTDPHGLSSPWSSWLSFSLVDPPAITGLFPADGETITYSTPTVSASVDRSVSSYRVEIVNAALLTVVDSGTVIGGTISYDVPTTKLRNDNTYTLRLTVNTVDGLSTVSTTTFTVDYVERKGLMGFSADPHPGMFEVLPGEESEVKLSWDELPSSSPASLVLRPGGSEGPDGPITPTITGAVRVVDTDEPMPGYDEVLPYTKNWISNPFAITAPGVGANYSTEFINEPFVHPVYGTWIPGYRRNVVIVPGTNVFALAHSANYPRTQGTKFVFQALVRLITPNPVGNKTVQLYEFETGGTTGNGGTGQASVSTSTTGANFGAGEWFHLKGTGFVKAPDRTGVTFYVQQYNLQPGDIVDVAAIQVEINVPEHTPFVPALDAGLNLMPHHTMLEPVNTQGAVRERTPSVPAWFIEEGTTNYAANPFAREAGGGWISGSSIVEMTWVTNANMIHPDGQVIDTAVRFAWTGYFQYGNTSNFGLWTTVPGESVTVSVLIRGAGTAIGKTVSLTAYENGTSSPSRGKSTVIITGGDQLITVSATTMGGGTNRVTALISIVDPSTGDPGGIPSQAGDVIYVTACQVERKAYRTSFCPELDSGGNLKPGYSWAGAAHASASTRANSFITYNQPDGLINSMEGSAVIRVPDGLRNVVLGNGYLLGLGYIVDEDFIGITAGTSVSMLAKTPATALRDMISGADNNAVREIYAEWTPSKVAILTNVSPRVESARSLPIGVANGDVNIGSYLGNQQINNPIGSIAIFNRPLTDHERSLVMSESLPTIEGLVPFASEADMGSQVIRRQDLTTGEILTLAELTSREETVYIDRTPPSGTTYRYIVSYYYLYNGVEWIESERVYDDVAVYLENTVLSDMTIAGFSVPLRYWSNRSIDLHTDTEVVETFGERPLVFQGVQRYFTVAGNFEVLTAPGGEFTSMDVVAALEDLASSRIDDQGRPVPKVICYRDPRGRVLYVSIVDLKEADDHDSELTIVSIAMTENATVRRVIESSAT